VHFPLPLAIARAIDRAVCGRVDGPILRNTFGGRMDRRAATRRLKQLAARAGIRIPRMHPHMLRHTYVTTMLEAGVSLREVQIAARHVDPRATMRYDRVVPDSDAAAVVVETAAATVRAQTIRSVRCPLRRSGR
jgi:site-specific recombinase XerD